MARGPLVLENCPETPATLTLYQLVFASRDILTGYGVIYKVCLVSKLSTETIDRHCPSTGGLNLFDDVIFQLKVKLGSETNLL